MISGPCGKDVEDENQTASNISTDESDNEPIKGAKIEKMNKNHFKNQDKVEPVGFWIEGSKPEIFMNIH